MIMEKWWPFQPIVLEKLDTICKNIHLDFLAKTIYKHYLKMNYWPKCNSKNYEASRKQQSRKSWKPSFRQRFIRKEKAWTTKTLINWTWKLLLLKTQNEIHRVEEYICKTYLIKNFYPEYIKKSNNSIRLKPNKNGQFKYILIKKYTLTH